MQLCLQWDGLSRSLFSGAIDGTLSRWDLNSMTLADLRKGNHKKAINDLLMVQDINLLASASSDGSILMRPGDMTLKSLFFQLLVFQLLDEVGYGHDEAQEDLQGPQEGQSDLMTRKVLRAPSPSPTLWPGGQVRFRNLEDYHCLLTAGLDQEALALCQDVLKPCDGALAQGTQTFGVYLVPHNPKAPRRGSLKVYVSIRRPMYHNEHHILLYIV